MWGLVYSHCNRAVQEGTHGVGTPHDTACLSKGNIENTEVRGLVYTGRKRVVLESMHNIGAPHDSASLSTGNIQNTDVRGLVYKRAGHEGTHGPGEGVVAPHTGASLNKGNIQNTEVREDSVVTACVAPHAGDTAFRIHCLRRSAYAAVLRAFCAQSDLPSRAKKECLAELRNKLKISDTEHREYIIKASTNKYIKCLRSWFYKGTIGNAEVANKSLDVKCVIPDAGDAAFQIHCLERSAYASVLRASCAQPDLLSWARLLFKLRNELRLSYIEHQEVIARVSSNDYIKSLRKLSLANYSGLRKKTPAFNRYAEVPDKMDKTGQSFTSLAPQSPMPAHTMPPARNTCILRTSYSTTKGPCFDPDTIAPDKKLKSGCGSALPYFKCPPCAAQLPEAVSNVVVESPKHDLLDRRTSPCAMKPRCALSPMFQEKCSQSNAGHVPWGVRKDMEASRERGAEASSPVSRSKSLGVINYSVGNIDHESDIIKILQTSCLVNKLEELFKAKQCPANLETAKYILKDQERHLLAALVRLSEVSSALASSVHLADEVECDEEMSPPKPVSSSSYDEPPTSSITGLRRAEAEWEVVKTQGEQRQKEGLGPSQSLKLTSESLALLDIPRDQARILPGHGWRPPDEGWMKINIDGSIAMDRQVPIQVHGRLV